MSLLTGPAAQLGAVGVLAVVVLAIVFGWLVPRKVARSIVDQANANAERWRAAAEASDKRADLAMGQSTEMLAALREVEALVRALDTRKVTS